MSPSILFDLEEKKRLGRDIMARKNLNRNNVTHWYNIQMGSVISFIWIFLVGWFWLVFKSDDLVAGIVQGCYLVY